MENNFPAPPFIEPSLRILIVAVLGVLVSGCNTLSRLSEMGEEPELSRITNPTARKDYRPVSMPMRPGSARENPNSLGGPARNLFQGPSREGNRRYPDRQTFPGR